MKIKELLIVVFIVINIFLLKKNVTLHEEIVFHKNNMKLTLEEQQLLNEHKIEGTDFSSKIEFLKNAIPELTQRQKIQTKFIMLLILSGKNCRRCMNMELRLLKDNGLLYKPNQLSVVIIFSDYARIDFNTICDQYKISEFSFYSEKIFSAVSPISSNPVVYLINSQNYVIYCNKSNYKDERKSKIFYNKVKCLL